MAAATVQIVDPQRAALSVPRRFWTVCIVCYAAGRAWLEPRHLCADLVAAEVYIMDIGIIVEGIEQSQFAAQPWMYCKDALLSKGIRIHVYHGGGDGFRRSFDAMCLHVWQDWRNRERFDAYRIMPVLEQFSTYRSRFPETIQIILNHTDMARRPYATLCWRDGNPVLYRTPAYDRTELAPFPPETIWSYEKVWGRNCFSLRSNPYRTENTMR